MKNLEFGDMIFYAIAGSILIILLWLRFAEETLGLDAVWFVCGVWTSFLIYRFAAARRSKSNRT